MIAVLKVFQNGKYDLNVLARVGIAVRPIDDTMVISFALDAGRGEEGMGGGHGMDELSQRHLGHTPIAFKDVCGTGKKADFLRRSAARPARPTMPPRMPMSPCGFIAISSRGWPRKAARASTSASTAR